jgi:hypothetical protein
MDNQPPIEAAADRIVRWAAQHPLSKDEAESRYAHLLASLNPIEAERDLRARWSAFDLGRLVIRYWRDRVEDLSESLASPAGAFSSLVAARGAAASEPRARTAERTLKAEGRTGRACVKLTAGADHNSLDLVLWLEPNSAGADSAFAVTVLGSAKTPLAGPTDCAARNLIRFNSIAPAEEYTLIFETAAERWEIRWGFSASASSSVREHADQ